MFKYTTPPKCLVNMPAASDSKTAFQLLRRIASQRRDHCELSLVNAMLKLLALDPTLVVWLDSHLTLEDLGEAMFEAFIAAIS
jgi:hypothetical protein